MAKPPDGETDSAGVMAPPPLIYLGFLVVGLAIGRFWPLTILGHAIARDQRLGIAVALIAAGIGIAIAGFRQFRKAGTDVRPDRPTVALVTGGIYRWSRNPLYIAQVLVYAGIAFGFDSLWALVLLVPMLIVIRYGVIGREEVYLERKFGSDYRRFKAEVRRWL
jgi:protein-S-isoprenylcysteine O-methyltransferase Ste14